jgi:hypothetical protein
MSAAHRRPQDAQPQDVDIGEEPQRRQAEAIPASGGSPPFDWQVLLLRYLPQPAGSTHVIKRLAPR